MNSAAETHPSSVVKIVQPVLVTDIHMPFTSMVGFMVKWAIAAIPAIIILLFIFAVISAVLGGFLASLIRS